MAVDEQCVVNGEEFASPHASPLLWCRIKALVEERNYAASSQIGSIQNYPILHDTLLIFPCPCKGLYSIVLSPAPVLQIKIIYPIPHHCTSSIGEIQIGLLSAFCWRQTLAWGKYVISFSRRPYDRYDHWSPIHRRSSIFTSESPLQSWPRCPPSFPLLCSNSILCVSAILSSTICWHIYLSRTLPTWGSCPRGICMHRRKSTAALIRCPSSTSASIS